MKLKVGAYYIRYDGEVVGPARLSTTLTWYTVGGLLYASDGVNLRSELPPLYTLLREGHQDAT